MTNRWGIPENELQKLRARDKKCPYCQKKMIYPYDVKRRKNSATIEHLNRFGPFYWKDGKKGLKIRDVVYCCQSCNSSRGRKKLRDWFKTEYCIKREINENTVSYPVKKYLNRWKKNRK